MYPICLLVTFVNSLSEMLNSHSVALIHFSLHFYARITFTYNNKWTCSSLSLGSCLHVENMLCTFSCLKPLTCWLYFIIMKTLFYFAVLLFKYDCIFFIWLILCILNCVFMFVLVLLFWCEGTCNNICFIFFFIVKWRFINFFFNIQTW